MDHSTVLRNDTRRHLREKGRLVRHWHADRLVGDDGGKTFVRSDETPWLPRR
jgi:hypothetical protein